METNRETFEQFIAHHPEYQPQPGEIMGSVWRKQHDAFIAFVDEQVGPLAELRQDIERIKAFLVL